MCRTVNTIIVGQRIPVNMFVISQLQHPICLLYTLPLTASRSCKYKETMAAAYGIEENGIYTSANNDFLTRRFYSKTHKLTNPICNLTVIKQKPAVKT